MMPCQPDSDSTGSLVESAVRGSGGCCMDSSAEEVWRPHAYADQRMLFSKDMVSGSEWGRCHEFIHQVRPKGTDSQRAITMRHRMLSVETLGRRHEGRGSVLFPAITRRRSGR